MSEVINKYGVEIDFEASVEYMDDDIREELHSKLAPCTEQEFFDVYAKIHKKVFGEEWELNKKSPVW